MRRLLLISICCIGLCQKGAAEAVYRWEDGRGNVFYSEAEPADTESARVQIEPPADGPMAVISRADGPPTTPSPPLRQPRATLDTEGLGPCALARQQLTLLHADVPVYLGADGLWHGADTRHSARSWLADASRPNAIREARMAVLRSCSNPDAVAAELEGRRSAGD